MSPPPTSGFCLLLALSSSKFVGGFQPKQTFGNSRSVVSSLLHSQAAHLKELATEWKTLDTRVKEFAKSSIRDESTAGELTATFLETAIDHAHTKESVEEEHVLQAHQEYEQALLEEDTLQMAYPLIADDTEHWMQPHRIYTRHTQNGTLLAEEFVRSLVADTDPHQMHEHFEHVSSNLLKAGQTTRIEQAHEKEVHAHEEEEEAKRTLEDLQEKEEILKATLDEFRAIQKAKAHQEKEDEAPPKKTSTTKYQFVEEEATLQDDNKEEVMEPIMWMANELA